MKKVLLLASGQWISTARLALELRAMGCAVEVVCSSNHPVSEARTPFVQYAYSPLRPLASLQRALEASKPDLVVPADELMVLHLEELWHQSEEGSSLRALIERSLGGEKVMTAARSRMALLDAAAAQNIDIPETFSISSDTDMDAAIAQLGLPLVLKADATSGGRGVRIVDSAAAAQRTWKLLHGPTSLARAAKRAMLAGEFVHLRPWAQGEVRGVTAQKFIRGEEHTAMAVCHEGSVLGVISMKVLNTWCERGPSSAVRVERDTVIEGAVTRLAGSLGISGFCGFDFITEASSGRRLLIEMNPRPTQLVHLPLGAGRDLVAAYARAFAGVPVDDRQSRAPNGLVALFPLELQRDPASPVLTQGYHDVPWAEPALIRRALRTLPPSISQDARWRGDDEQRVRHASPSAHTV